jgi:hypothetical protein
LAPFSASWQIGCQGFTEPNLFTLLNKNQTPFLRKEYLICWAKVKRIFGNTKSSLFISFAPPKEMNQRKGGRKCQLQPKRAPATQALLALPFCLKFAPFPVCSPAVI